MKAAPHLIWFFLVDLPLSLLRALLAVVGVFVVPVALLFRSKGDDGPERQYDGWQYKRLPWVFAPWDNFDYGTKGNSTYGEREAYNPHFHEEPTSFWSQWYWLAIRNPANGTMYLWPFSCRASDCRDVRYLGRSEVNNNIYGWQFVWTRHRHTGRPFTGFYAMLPWLRVRGVQLHMELRFGHKLLVGRDDRERPFGMSFKVNPLKGL